MSNDYPTVFPKLALCVCDSVISTTFVMLWFPNQLPSPTPTLLPSNSLKMSRRHHMVCCTQHMVLVTTGCILVPPPPSLFAQLLQGQITSTNRVKSTKILQIFTLGFRMRSHKCGSRASSDACKLMWLLLCDSQEVGKGEIQLPHYHYFLNIACSDDNR